MEKLFGLHAASRGAYYTLTASVAGGDAPALSKIIERVVELSPVTSVAAAVRWAMEHVERWVELEERHALTGEILNAPSYLQQIEDAKKAHAGWPTTQTTEFVSEDSQEYLAWLASKK